MHLRNITPFPLHTSDNQSKPSCKYRTRSAMKAPLSSLAVKVSSQHTQSALMACHCWWHHSPGGTKTPLSPLVLSAGQGTVPPCAPGSQEAGGEMQLHHITGLVDFKKGCLQQRICSFTQNRSLKLIFW